MWMSLAVWFLRIDDFEYAVYNLFQKFCYYENNHGVVLEAKEMLKVERQNIIEQEIKKQGFVMVPGLSKLLNCSEETIRRDLREMEANGRLLRTHGGAYLIEQYDKGYPIELRQSYYPHVKERLADQALSYIKENDVVMLDSSTTCLAIATAILAHGLKITLITNSLAISNLCNESDAPINLIGIGGTFRKRTSSFADPNTVEAIKRYYADKAFVSCPKVSIEQGLSDNHISEATVRKQMIKNSQMRFLVVDHTKFEGNANILFDGLEDINVIITDQKLSSEWEMYTMNRKIEIRYSSQ